MGKTKQVKTNKMTPAKRCPESHESDGRASLFLKYLAYSD